jgi:mRNA-degrading endonuclease RelE of RelBE toxin-antitoxin system
VATSNPTLRIELSPEFGKAIRRLSKSKRRPIGQVLNSIQDGFGKPHLHSGLGIRRLRGNYFECRAGFRLRLVFRAERGVLTFTAAGDHDEMRKLLKDL